MLMNGCANGETDESSTANYSKAVIENLKLGEYNLDVSKLPKSSEAALDARLKSGGLESFDFPKKARGMDAFRYTVYVDQKAKEYWVEKKGGVRPVREIYGPAQLPMRP